MRFVVHVSVLVEHDGRIAMVCEGKPENRGKWNLPGGHLKLGEGLVAGAARELREETGLETRLTGFLGVYAALGEHHFLNFVFTARADNSSLQSPSDDVLASKWFSVPDLLALPEEQVLNPRKLRRILEDYRTRGPYGIECIRELMLDRRAADLNDHGGPAG